MFCHFPGKKSSDPERCYVLRGVFLLGLTHREEDGLVDVNIGLQCYNMAMNGSACNDGTS